MESEPLIMQGAGENLRLFRIEGCRIVPLIKKTKGDTVKTYTIESKTGIKAVILPQKGATAISLFCLEELGCELFINH